ncbi:flagellar biosynthetic protein FliO [Edaphobacter sp.]|uniref:flagellar biosynthetic protein FliO n=1 Tax=Edaphobacter sp. TaxID=1934404 RepID=UPI003995023F
MMHSLRGAVRVSGTKTSAHPGGLAGWLLGRLGEAGAKRQAAIKQMRLLDTLPLGGRRNLMLVSCAGELFLVGGSAESIESIVRVQGGTSQSIAAKGMDGLCL